MLTQDKGRRKEQNKAVAYFGETAEIPSADLNIVDFYFFVFCRIWYDVIWVNKADYVVLMTSQGLPLTLTMHATVLIFFFYVSDSARAGKNKHWIDAIDVIGQMNIFYLFGAVSYVLIARIL